MIYYSINATTYADERMTIINEDICILTRII